MRARWTSACVCACLAAVPVLAAPPPAAAGARAEVASVTPLLRAGKPAHLRVRLSFTGERVCRLAFKRGGLAHVSPETLTEHRLVTWRWRVPRSARSGVWTLRAECGAEAELTLKTAVRVRLVGTVSGPWLVARRVNVFTSGDPLVVAFVRRP